jgi:quercetin dioxygenase-like cupin family protein
VQFRSIIDEEKDMRTAITIAGILLMSQIRFAGQAHAQQPGITRAELQRHDLDIPGREEVQARIDFAPGASFPRHSHPGDEIIYVLKGSPACEVEDRPPVTLNAGGVLFIPAGAIHAARNVGSGEAAELGTYVVEKDKPLVLLAK